MHGKFNSWKDDLLKEYVVILCELLLWKKALQVHNIIISIILIFVEACVARSSHALVLVHNNTSPSKQFSTECNIQHMANYKKG